MNSLLTRNGLIAMAAVALSVVAIAGQAKPKAATTKGGENGMVGIKLYDTGARVIAVYGNPTEIQPVSFGGGSIGPAGGGAGGGGFQGGGAPGGGGGGAAATAAAEHSPFGFGDDFLMQRGGAAIGGPDGDDERGGGVGRGGPGGPPAGFPGAPGGRPGNPGGAGTAGGGAGGKIVYTRWIYKRGTSKYGFILDRYNRVVQIEAIGMTDGKVRTSKGVHFGSTFGDIIKKYQTPDGYEINGDNIVVRYLVRNKVAFRLSRLGANKPHTVTGIVVAGGKT